MKILVKWSDYDEAGDYQFGLKIFADLQSWSEYKETLLKDFPKRFTIEDVWHFDYVKMEDFLACFEIMEVPDNVLEIFCFSNVYFENRYFPYEFFQENLK